MKRIVMFAMLVVTGLGVFAQFAPASADSHKDNFRRECNTSRKCYLAARPAQSPRSSRPPRGGRFRVGPTLPRRLIRKPSAATARQGCVAKMHMLRHAGLRGLASVFACVRARFHHFRA